MGYRDVPDGVLAHLEVEGREKEPLAPLSSALGGCGVESFFGCTGLQGVQGSGSNGSREGALAHFAAGTPAQIGPRLSAPWTEAAGGMAWQPRVWFGHPPGSALPRPLWVPLWE